MAEVAGRHVLFSGCAYSRSGDAPRHATIALIKALGIDPVYEAPDTGCCGARADRWVNDSARLRTLSPVYELAGQGADVICLSPACRRVVRAFMPPPKDSGIRPAAVRDVAQVLTDVYGLTRLAEAAPRGLVGLRVALHSVCHGNHNVLVREEFLTGGLMTRGFANLTRALSGSASLPQLLRERGALIRPSTPVDPTDMVMLSRIMAATGASTTADVSVSGRCAEVPLMFGVPGTVMGRRKASPCLLYAARAEADVLVTPCFLCYMALNANQRGLSRTNPARDIPVLHLSQLVGVAFEVPPSRLELKRATASPRRALQPFVV